MPPPPHPTEPATSLRRSGAGRSPDTRLDPGLRRNDDCAVCDCRIHRPAASLVRLLVGLLLAIGLTAALAESVSVGDLRLDYGDAWQRASAEEEAQAESVILRQAESSGLLTVIIPKHQSRLRVPEARFYQQLETVWRAGAGEALRLDWLEAGGRRWRVARRPSVEDPDRAVFHLVTVLEGHAHHLLVSVPAGVAELPPAVRRILDGEAMRQPRPPGGDPSQAAGGPATAPPIAPPAAGWRLQRVIRVLPGSAQLDRLLARERHALAGDGGISGVMLQIPEDGLTVGLEGFIIVKGSEGRSARQPLARRWQITWSPAPAHWPDGFALEFKPRLAAGSESLVLAISLRLLCGPPQSLQPILQGLEHGSARVVRDVPVGHCPPASGQMQAEIAALAGAGAYGVSFLAPDPPALPAGEQALLVLSVMPRVPGGGVGQALLGALAVHYVYVRAP